MHLSMDDDDDQSAVYGAAMVDDLLTPSPSTHHAVAAAAGSFPSSSSSSASFRSASVSYSPDTSSSAAAAAATGFYPELSSQVAPLLPPPPLVRNEPQPGRYTAGLPPPPPPPVTGGAFRRYARHLGPRRASKPGACGQRMFKTAMSVLANMHVAATYRRQYYYQQAAAAAAAEAAPALPSDNQLQHTMSERKRREKLNGSFVALKAVLPPGSKTAMSVLANMHVAATYRRQYYYQQAAAAAAAEAAPALPSDNQLQHTMSERKRREKLNGSFVALKAVLPPGSKKDKTSILIRAREYVKSLESKLSELEEKNRELEARLSTRPAAKNDKGETAAPPEAGGEVKREDPVASSPNLPPRRFPSMYAYVESLATKWRERERGDRVPPWTGGADRIYAAELHLRPCRLAPG
uniref:BHLH domain-containing protein n=1 Tax=Oryza meridionalis TaxID=40149 RepID=A0A0E0BYK6_9ORYZ